MTSVAMAQTIDKLERLADGAPWEELMISDFFSNTLEAALPHLDGLPEVKDMVIEELEFRAS